MSEESYVDKCFKCKHCYTRKNKNEAEDYIYCRLKECRFESKIEKKLLRHGTGERDDRSK